MKKTSPGYNRHIYICVKDTTVLTTEIFDAVSRQKSGWFVRINQ